MPTKKNFLGGQQNYDPKNGEYRPSLVGKGGNVVTDADGDGIAHETKTRKFRDKNGKYWKTEERPEEETKTWGNDHTFLQQIDENGKEVYDYGSRGWHPNGMLKDYEELFDDANREGLAKKEDGWDFNEDSQTYTSKDGEVFSKQDYEKKFGGNTESEPKGNTQSTSKSNNYTYNDDGTPDIYAPDRWGNTAEDYIAEEIDYNNPRAVKEYYESGAMGRKLREQYPDITDKQIKDQAIALIDNNGGKWEVKEDEDKFGLGMSPDEWDNEEYDDDFNREQLHKDAESFSQSLERQKEGKGVSNAETGYTDYIGDLHSKWMKDHEFINGIEDEDVVEDIYDYLDEYNGLYDKIGQLKDDESIKQAIESSSLSKADKEKFAREYGIKTDKPKSSGAPLNDIEANLPSGFMIKSKNSQGVTYIAREDGKPLQSEDYDKLNEVYPGIEYDAMGNSAYISKNGKVASKGNPLDKQPKSDPLSEDNLHSMFKQGLTEDEVVNEIRKANPDIPNGDLQGAVEAFAMTNYPNQTSLNATLGKINQGKTKMNQVEPTKPKQLMNPSTPSYMSDQRYTRTKEALTKAGYKPKNEANPTNGYIEFEKPDGISFFYNTENGEIEDDGIRSWSADDFSGKTDSIMKETAGSMWGKNFKTEDDLQKAIDRSESRYQYSKQFYDEDVKEYGQYPTSGERYNLNDLVDAVNDSIDEINNYSRIAKKRGFNVKTKGGYEKINKRH